MQKVLGSVGMETVIQPHRATSFGREYQVLPARPERTLLHLCYLIF